MLNLSNLSKKERIYLAELINSSRICQTEITADILNSLKQKVLESALETVRGKIDRRKLKVLEKIIGKVVYPAILVGEILVPEENRLKN